MTRREEIAARRRNTWIAVGLHSDKIVRDLREIVRLEKLGETTAPEGMNSAVAPIAGNAAQGEPASDIENVREPDPNSSC